MRVCACVCVCECECVCVCVCLCACVCVRPKTLIITNVFLSFVVKTIITVEKASLLCLGRFFKYLLLCSIKKKKSQVSFFGCFLQIYFLACINGGYKSVKMQGVNHLTPSFRLMGCEKKVSGSTTSHQQIKCETFNSINKTCHENETSHMILKQCKAQGFRTM